MRTLPGRDTGRIPLSTGRGSPEMHAAQVLGPQNMRSVH
jgi:hypothetical protein